MPQLKNRFRVGLVLLLGLTFLGAAIYEGVTFGVPRLHLVEEAVVFAVGLAWVTYLLMRAESVRRASAALVEQLRSAQAALENAHVEMSSLSQGIADKVDQKLVEWGLTRSEREVATLLLKGLGHRQIGEIRNTAERTVRQQAASVYQKAGLSGRAELSAYFFEDILVLPESASASSDAPSSIDRARGDLRTH